MHPVALLLLLLLLTLQIYPNVSIKPQHSPYQIYNFTWVIINQAGDIVNSSSSLGTQPSWPSLEMDLCALALGASADWGTPSHYWPQSRLVDAPNPNYDGHLIGCNSYDRIVSLANDPSGLYVCPGRTHRGQSQNYKCGYSSDYYCASWGCETTGDAYWRPHSSWDYITLRRKFLPTYLQDKLGIKTAQPFRSWCEFKWCVPLLISFMDVGRSKDWTGQGYEFGLRLRECSTFTLTCSDPRLIFRIKLLKSIPNKNVAAVGPNPAIQHPRPPAKPVPRPGITAPAILPLPTSPPGYLISAHYTCGPS